MVSNIEHDIDTRVWREVHQRNSSLDTRPHQRNKARQSIGKLRLPEYRYVIRAAALRSALATLVTAGARGRNDRLPSINN